MFAAALSWFDRQRPAPKHGELPAPAPGPDRLAEIARPDDEPAADGDRRLFDDDGEPIRPPGAQDRPADARADSGKRETPAERVESATVALDNREATVTPTDPPYYPAASPAHVAGGYADGGPVPAREPVVAGQLDRDLAATKRQGDWPEPPDYGRPPTRTGEVLLEIDQQIAGSLAARNQALRAQLRTVAAERDAARKRVAELELTVKALGEVIAHAAGHDKASDTTSDADGGE